MSIELLIAPPASGKTHTCIERIQALRKGNPLAKVWVIVPDRLQAASFRRRLAQSGGALGVQVGRFPDLLKSLLEDSGDTLLLASRPLINRLIQETVDDAVTRGEIPYYAPLQFFPGFILALRDVFDELKRAMVTPQQFTQYVNAGTAGHKDLARLYSAYQDRLESIKWVDSEDINLRAARLLQENESIAAAIRLLIVDGFDSFNGAQLQLLKLLSAQVGEMLITFPGALESNRAAHRRFIETIDRLIRDLSLKVVTLNNAPFLAPVLQHIEHNLFDTQPVLPVSVDRKILLEARSPADEAREALRWIKKLVVRENIPLTACAIFTPDPATYHPLLHASAGEFGIPIRFTLDEPLENSPAITSLVNLLVLKVKGYNSHYLINTLRSPYFTFPVEPEIVDTFEMVSRVAQVVEGQAQWEEAWQRLEVSTEKEHLNLDDERNAPKLPRGEDAKVLHLIMRSVFEIISPPDDHNTITGWITWLEDLLEQLKFYEHTESERDRSAGAAFRELLRALVLSESVAGERQLDYAQFFALLQAAVAGEGFREAGVIGQPALLVGRMTEARGTRFQAVALLGLAEGSFPVNERPDPFLDEDLRAGLGLESRLQREQAGLYYQAVTRADRYLLITRPYLSDDGEEWEESAFWKATARLLEKSAVFKSKTDNLIPLVDAASTQELLFSAVRRGSLPSRFNFLLDNWHALQHAQVVLRARRAKRVGGEHEGVVEAIIAELNQRYSVDRVWSASRLESYSNCPFQFFVNSALHLEPRAAPELGLDASQMGSILHKVLEETYLAVSDPLNLDQLLDALHRVSRQVFASAPREFGFRPSALWEIEQEHWLEKLEATITALTEDRNWIPFAYEQKFGLEGTPALSIEVGDEQVLVHGVIDRVDRNSDGELRVVDYKTGSSHLGQKDLVRGYRLQLPIYALAARDALDLGQPVDGFYWKILNAEAGSLRLSKCATDDAEGMEAAVEITRGHLLRILTGIRSAQFPPQKPDGGCPPYCPAAQWCWRYEPGW